MSKLRLKISMSLDGFVAGPDQSVKDPLGVGGMRLLGRPFKLSSLLARTVRPGALAQPIHVDSPADALGWTMVGFILMIDPFHAGNGATRFVPGSHRADPDRFSRVGAADCDGQVLACAPAGSVVVYNSAVWHGHTANPSAAPRRSIQGAFIRREGRSAADPAAFPSPETLGRVGSLAKYVLGLD
jgi:ectoine hydroxylase-related dioxygenase (phytanoyl-CoA dioxygenase family)